MIVSVSATPDLRSVKLGVVVGYVVSLGADLRISVRCAVGGKSQFQNCCLLAGVSACSVVIEYFVAGRVCMSAPVVRLFHYVTQ